jgi:hypothetical protein
MTARSRPLAVAVTVPWGDLSWEAFSAWENRIPEFASGFGVKKAVFEQVNYALCTSRHKTKQRNAPAAYPKSESGINGAPCC